MGFVEFVIVCWGWGGVGVGGNGVYDGGYWVVGVELSGVGRVEKGGWGVYCDCLDVFGCWC